MCSTLLVDDGVIPPLYKVEESLFTVWSTDATVQHCQRAVMIIKKTTCVSNASKDEAVCSARNQRWQIITALSHSAVSPLGHRNRKSIQSNAIEPRVFKKKKKLCWVKCIYDRQKYAAIFVWTRLLVCLFVCVCVFLNCTWLKSSVTLCGCNFQERTLTH